jgi:hypothetical protein
MSIYYCAKNNVMLKREEGKGNTWLDLGISD